MRKNLQHQTLTVGELCYAIAEGRLPVTVKDNQYQVNARELRRYVNGQQSAIHAIPRILHPVKR